MNSSPHTLSLILPLSLLLLFNGSAQAKDDQNLYRAARKGTVLELTRPIPFTEKTSHDPRRPYLQSEIACFTSQGAVTQEQDQKEGSLCRPTSEAVVCTLDVNFSLYEVVKDPRDLLRAGAIWKVTRTQKHEGRAGCVYDPLKGEWVCNGDSMTVNLLFVNHSGALSLSCSRPRSKKTITLGDFKAVMGDYLKFHNL